MSVDLGSACRWLMILSAVGESQAGAGMVISIT